MKFLSKLLSLVIPFAFDAADMNRLQAGTLTVWAYKSDDAIAAIEASGYFDNHVDWLKKGDIIMVAGNVDGTPTVDLLVVSSADNATPVTTVNGS